MNPSDYYPDKEFSLGITAYKLYLETTEFIEFINKLFGPSSTLGIPVLTGDNDFVGDNTFTGETEFTGNIEVTGDVEITGDLTVDDTILMVDADSYLERTSAGNLTIHSEDELLLSSEESVRIKINTPATNASFPDSGSVSIEVASSGLQAGVAGDGGNITFTSGTAANTTGNNAGGTAGKIILVTGNGSNTVNSNSTGGGEVTITTGTGGTASGTGRGGNGGDLTIYSGDGGDGDTNGGSGGNLLFNGGDGGDGSTLGGNGGSVIITPGLAGTIGNSQNGKFSVRNADATDTVSLSPIYENTGLMTKNVLKVVYDTAIDAIGIGANVAINSAKLPDNSIITNAWYVITQGFDSATSSATIAIGVATDDANGIEAATGVILLGQGTYQGDPNNAIANFTTITTDRRDIIFTVAVEALTIGRMVLFIEYITL